ncbi:MAG: glycoside hydrolase family 3 protein [Clostridia bacterium]|nr:glycoside hydrolase family 3 protein [Clostridia bacterium]
MKKENRNLKIIVIAVCVFVILLANIFLILRGDPVSKRLKELSLHDKITQMMMISFRYWDDKPLPKEERTAFTVMNNEVRSAIEKYHFGAVIYFAQNLEETQQAYQLTADMQQAAVESSGIPMLICADQEGGSVVRLKSGTALPGNMALGAARDSQYAVKAGQVIGSELSAIGLNTNLAPVVDVNNNANNPIIGLRSYSDDPLAVGELAASVIAGVEEYGVISCAKHFPGHGDTAEDSHYSLPIVDKSIDTLLECELVPYRTVIDKGVDMIMTSHILYPQLEPDTAFSKKTGKQESLPATMSDDIITGLLKENMKFQGIVVTDAMNMNGITEYWEPEDAVIYAIQAGADMICMPCEIFSPEDFATLDMIIEAVETAVEDGTIPMSRIDDAVQRILTVKHDQGILDYNASDYSLEKAQEVIGSSDNREIEREIAAAAVTVVQNKNDVLPLKLTAESKVLMAVPYENEQGQLIMGWNRAKDAGLIPDGSQVKTIHFNEESTIDTFKAELDWADTIIFNSEVYSASEMNGKQWTSGYILSAIEYAENLGKVTIVQSADKPYDVQSYLNADAVLAIYGNKGSSVDPTEALLNQTTYSDTAYGPNIIAGIEVVFGVFPARGRLPVNIPYFENEEYTNELIFARGHGLTYDRIESGQNKTE